MQHRKMRTVWETITTIPRRGATRRRACITVPVTLLAQLQSLEPTPKDINFIAFSHLHWDHTGNANEFPDSVQLWHLQTVNT